MPTAALAELPAHGGVESNPGVWIAWPTWDVTAQPVLLVVSIALLYSVGVARFSRRGPGAHVSPGGVAAMGGALLAFLVAVASPLERLAGVLFAAHMAQHLVLMLIVAPLIVLARPHRMLLWAFPLHVRRVIGPAVMRITRTAESLPAVAVIGVYGAVLWAWHVPPAYEAAEGNRLIHDLEHLSFVTVAVLFWARIRAGAEDTATGQWRAIPFLLTGMLIGLALGLGLTWSPQPWYDSHVASAPEWGFTAREDQQLGGLLMLIPAMAVQLGVLGVLFARASANHERAARAARMSRQPLRDPAAIRRAP